MANAFLDSLITDSAVSNTDFSRKIKTLSKKYADESTKEFRDLVGRFSPAEQRFWCLIRMKHTMEIHMEKKPDQLYKDIIVKLKLSKKPSDRVRDEDFNDLVEDYSTAIIKFLDENEGEDLLSELNIQKSEFKTASKQNQKGLIIKGLICLALSTASIALVIMQGAMCAVASVPMTLLGASYSVLAYEIDPITALGHALHWVKNFSENKQMNGMAAIFVFGAEYYRAVKPDLLLKELFKAAPDILPTIPTAVLGLAVAAAAPPFILFKKCYEFNKTSKTMDTLFKNGKMKEPVEESIVRKFRKWIGVS